METLGKQKGPTAGSVTNRIQEVEERISGAEDTIEEIKSLVKENNNPKNTLHQTSWKSGTPWKKLKPKNNRDRRKRTTPTQRHRNYTQQKNNRKKPFPTQRRINLWRYKKLREHQIDWTKKNFPKHIMIKMQNIENEERILRAAKDNAQVQ